MAEEKKNGGWFSTFLRFGCLIAALVGSLDLVAAPRVWTLNNVQFSDGAIATGYFSYDDASQIVTNWDVRVSQGPLFPGLTTFLATLPRLTPPDGFTSVPVMPLRAFTGF